MSRAISKKKNQPGGRGGIKEDGVGNKSKLKLSSEGVPEEASGLL